jgi:hypothetical protein
MLRHWALGQTTIRLASLVWLVTLVLILSGCSESVTVSDVVVNQSTIVKRAAYLRGTGVEVDLLKVINALGGTVNVIVEPKDTSLSRTVAYDIGLNHKRIVVSSDTFINGFEEPYDSHVRAPLGTNNGVHVLLGDTLIQILSDAYPSAHIEIRGKLVYIDVSSS